MPAPTLLLQPHRAGLPAGRPFRLDVLVRVQAPDAPPTAAPRPPLHLALVLDRSGSMSGRPLQEAKRCALAIAERLQPQDQLALVTYDHRAETVLPLAPVADPEAFRQAVARVRSGGCTNLHLGWATGLKQLQRARQPEVLSRVLLLSDGQANEGLVDPAALADQAGTAAEAGVSTSTYGLGHQFEEQVMSALARAGRGRAAYAETATDLLDPFLEEFDLLANLFARKLALAVQVPAGVQVTQLNGYPQLEPGTWALPDLGYAAEAWAVLRLEGDAARFTERHPVDLLRVDLRWADAQGVEGELPPQSLTLPALAPEAFLALPKDELVVRRAGELLAADLQARAYRACLEDDWDEVRRLLDELRELAKTNPWTEATLQELEELAEQREREGFRKEVYYQSMTSSQRLADKDEGFILYQSSVNSYTRRKKRQGKGGEGQDGPSNR